MLPTLSSKYSSTPNQNQNGAAHEDSAPERLNTSEVRVSMTRVVAAWGFGAAFFNLSSGAIYTSFARGIGANDFVFGVLAGALPLMSFLQVIAARMLASSGDGLEMGELVIRYRFKRRYLHLWIAISRLTHQVIGFWIGDRSFKYLWQFWFSLLAAYRKKLVYTDFYEAYSKLFAAWRHRPCGKGIGKTALDRDSST